MREIAIGTRGSALALWQAHWVAECIEKTFPDQKTKIVIIKTKGDIIKDVALSRLGGRGAFTKELDEALLDGRVDICVHSMKDVPSELPEGTYIAAMLRRASALDAYIGYRHVPFIDLPKGARVGTGSLRRRAQLLALRPDLELVEVRGNINTRIKKVESGELDAMILAEAGLARMGWQDRITSVLEPDVMLPAVGQGAVGIQARSDDKEVLDVLSAINDAKTFMQVSAEREIMIRLDGGCQVPLAVHARDIDMQRVLVEAMVSSLDGSRMIKARYEGVSGDILHVARKVLDQLIEQGAQDILEEARNTFAEQEEPVEVLYD